VVDPVIPGAGPVPDDAADLLLLQELPRVGPATVKRLLERFGTAERALTARAEHFVAVAGRQAEAGRHDPELRRGVSSALTRATSLGLRVETWSGSRYPEALRRLADPPPVLFLAGHPELLGHEPAVTVVGARRATARARDVAERLGAALARAGVTVVSGLALGVDGAAHVGALRVDGQTVAVLGSGADVAYPRAHRRLFERIRRAGLVVSEFLPGTPAAPHHFPRRNRILAALAGATVVVEAGARSGALITVDHALDLGKDVWAVPGPIDRSVCAGSNRLLADGARPLVSIDEFVAHVAGRAEAEGFADVGGARRDDPASSLASAPRRDPPGDASSPTASLEERVLRALAADALLADELAERFAVPVPQVLALLTTLELYGEVVRLPGMRYRAAA
jgi:DNA processing protein